MKSKSMQIFSLLVMLTIILSGCGAAATPAPVAQPTQPPAPAQLTKVTLQLQWFAQSQFAGYYAALDKGYYKSAGLDVKIVRGQGSTDAVKQVASGAAQMGFADTSAVIFAKANDGIPVKLVSVIYAKPPHAIYVLKESGITKPKDLEGRKLADTAFSAMPNEPATMRSDLMMPKMPAVAMAPTPMKRT